MTELRTPTTTANKTAGASGDLPWESDWQFPLVGLIVALAVLHVILAFALVEKPTRPNLTTAGARPPAIAAISTQASEPSADLPDPVLFIWPSAYGFSAPVWLLAPPPPAPSPDWSTPLASLDAYPFTPELVLQYFEPRPTPPTISIHEKPVLWPLHPLAPALEHDLHTGTTIETSGELRHRRLVLHPPLRIPAGVTNLPTPPTVVQVGVDAAGLPVFVSVISTSGAHELDTIAIEWVRAARWMALESRAGSEHEFTWGCLAFWWAESPQQETPQPQNAK